MVILQSLRAQAARSSASPAIHAPGRQPATYACLEAAVTRIGATLAGLGVRRTDRIALVCSNGPEIATAFLGISTHAACAPLNPAYRAGEFEFFLGDLGAQAVVVEAGLDSPVRAVAGALGIPVFELTPHFSQAAGELTIAGPAIRAPEPGSPSGPEDVALLLHTSGTTSRPKLVPLTQANLAASARHIAGSLKLSEDDRCLNVMPLFHIHGLEAAVLASLASGGSVVCCPGFVAPKFFQWVGEFRPTWYTAVPTMHQSIVARAADHREIVERNRFRFIRSCSAALAPSLMAEMEEIFQAPVVEAYGMTEAAHQMASNPLPPGERRPGSVGVAAGPEIAIMDEAGALLPPGASGEVVIRGPNVMAGYAANAKANAEAFTGGWFRTGDLGHLDAQGYLFLSGRLKEIINRGGEKIAPREIDEVLLCHPDVSQAVAFAAPHATLGEAVAAAVVARPGLMVTERELREFAAQRLADFKVPEKILFVEEIPKGATGKLQRIGLAAKLGVEEIKPSPRDRSEFVAPRSEAEKRIAALFAATLGVPRAGVRDNFFDLGGDSLLLVALLANIAGSTGVEIPVLTFLDDPTVHGVCRILESQPAACAGPPVDGVLRLVVRPGQSRPALFCIPGSYGDVTGFCQLARHLEREQPVIAFRLPAANGKGGYRIEDLAGRYVEEVFTAQPEGPYHLAGMCTGGLVAYEMARQIVDRGKAVGLLALVDCYNQAWAEDMGPVDKLGCRLRLLRRRLAHLSRDLARSGLRGAAGCLRPRLAAWFETTRHRMEESAHKLILRAGLKPPAAMNNSRLAIRYAAGRYSPPSWPGRLELFRAGDPRVDAYDYPDMGWRGLAKGGIAIHEVPGSNLAMLSEPNVKTIAGHLQVSLRRWATGAREGPSPVEIRSARPDRP